MKKIALICADKIGKEMAGPGIRYLEMAKALSDKYKVKLLVPEECDFKEKYPGLDFRVYRPNKPAQLIFPLIRDCAAVIAQNLRPPLIWRLKRAGIKYIVDLYDPLIIETLEYHKYDATSYRNTIYDFHLNNLLLQLVSADHIICASDQQRNFYFGLMFHHGTINPRFYGQNPETEAIISLIPFGLPDSQLTVSDEKVVEKNFPGIKPNDCLVYWGGGIWNWFDPMSVVKAIEHISKKRPDIKLFFLGVKHPNPKIKEMEVAKKVLDYCKDKDLLGKFVFFNFGWTPYEERANYLGRADIGISTHLNNLETHFSFRTRILDYLWANLPMVVTKGDAMAEFVKSRNLGLVVDYRSVPEITEAIIKLADDKNLSRLISANINEAKKCFYWQTIIGRLSSVINNLPAQPKQIGLVDFGRLSLAYYYYGLKKKLLK